MTRAPVDLGQGCPRLDGIERAFGPMPSASYAPSAGIPMLRELIADLHGARRDEVAVTAGASGALAAALLCLDPGSPVLAPRPYYPGYPTLIELLGRRVHFYDIVASDTTEAVLGKIDRALGAGAKAVLWNDPSNPLGTRHGEPALRSLLELCARRGVTVIADEAYAGLSLDHHDPDPFGPALIHCTRVRSLSKLFQLAGERVGYAIAPPPVVSRIIRSHRALSISGPLHGQRVAAGLLQQGVERRLVAMSAALRENRDRAVSMLATVDWLEMPPAPAAGVFLWCRAKPGAVDPRLCVAEVLRRKSGVIVMSGPSFGASNGWFRLSYAVREQDLVRGLQAIVNLRGSDLTPQAAVPIGSSARTRT